MNQTKKSGLLAVLASIGIFLLEKVSNNFISSIIGKIICGDKYLQEVNGTLSNLSCGFNSDMYLATFLVLLLIIGLIMLAVGSVKKIQSH